MNRSKNLIFSFSLLALTVATVALAAPNQNPPKGVITWQAQTTAPDTYLGKLQLNRTSPLVGALLVTQDGMIMDLRKKEIGWYLNGKLINRGVGLSTITIQAERPDRRQIELRALIKNFSGFDSLDTRVSINRNPPKVSLISPSLVNLRGHAVGIKALSYFFTPTENNRIQYRWQVDGVVRAVLNNTLVLDTSQADINQPVNISVSAYHPDNSLESAETAIKIIIP